MNKLSRMILSTALLLGGVTAAMAHGSMTHLMGTVEKVSETQLTVRTVEGKSQSVSLNADTKFKAMEKAGNREDLLVGMRVAVEAKDEHGSLTAAEVSFGVPAKDSDAHEGHSMDDAPAAKKEHGHDDAHGGGHDHH